MGKIPLVLVLVIALWVGITVWREGPDQAFGGLFAVFASPQYGEQAPETRLERLADEVTREAAPEDDTTSSW